jgi:DNA mismatch repair ATPase MutS
VALITVLAQIGCFVPAEDCFLPVRQRLLSRIGTGDDIENNLSTFLMEMKDAAYICKHSGEKSLVLVDELGRGTANRDGSAIAWGVVILIPELNLCQLPCSPSLLLYFTAGGSTHGIQYEFLPLRDTLSTFTQSCQRIS